MKLGGGLALAIVAVMLASGFAAASASHRNNSYLAFAQQSSGSVVIINEVELNPKGRDGGKEWVELYNPTGSDVAIGGYALATSYRPFTVNVPAGATIGAGQFYVVAIEGERLANSDSLTLTDASGQVVDRTPSLVDRSDSGLTWQRMPDGGSQWKLVEGTQGTWNDPASRSSSSSQSSSSSAAVTPPTPPPSPQQTPGSGESGSDGGKCSGSALCFEGKVVRIADADTVYVEKTKGEVYKVDLSLTKVVARSDRSLTQNLCLGNSALVDQDDRQPGRGKNIMGAVYCSSSATSLNQQLLDSGYASIDPRQCSTSEFAGTEWAKRYGCS